MAVPFYRSLYEYFFILIGVKTQDLMYLSMIRKFNERGLEGVYGKVKGQNLFLLCVVHFIDYCVFLFIV